MLPESLRKYFEDAKYFEDEAFGPTTAEDIADAPPEIKQLFFYTENKIYSELLKRPSFIIGRRGAGKTVFLQGLHLKSDFKVVAEVKSNHALERIISAVKEMAVGPLFCETVADFWDILFWVAILNEVPKAFSTEPARVSLIKKYLSGLRIRPNASVEAAICLMMSWLRENTENKSLADIVVTTELRRAGGVTLDEARQLACELLKEKKSRGVLLLDSLEDFHLKMENLGHVISGLLKCLGNFNKPSNPFEVRFCLPAELFFSFEEYSASDAKDFRRQVPLHWHAGELMRMAAHRYALFLELYEPEFFRRSIDGLNFDDRSDAGEFFHKILPPQIENGLGSIEPNPIAYILRHTQLLPRQFLIYLNEIFQTNRRTGGTPSRISDGAIRVGIRQVEKRLCNEVFEAFHYRHPEAKSVCEKCIPELPLRFSHGTLHRVFNQFGKKVMPEGTIDEFKRLLFEIGAIGRFVGDSEFYAKAEFEYTAPEKLIVSTDDELCLHPMFTECFRAKKPARGSGGKVVYPHGCDPQGPDHRDF